MPISWGSCNSVVGTFDYVGGGSMKELDLKKLAEIAAKHDTYIAGKFLEAIAKKWAK